MIQPSPLYNLCLLGHPGIGKTEWIRTFARSRNLRLHTVILSAASPEDLLGIPFRDGDSVKMSLPDWARDAIAHPTLLFFDEATNTPRHLWSPVLTLLASREIHGQPLHSETVIVLAANPPESAADGQDFPPPVQSRLVMVDFPVDVTAFADNFPTYWGNPPAWDTPAIQSERVKIAAYIRRNPNALVTYKPGAKSFACPRAWDYLSRAAGSGAPIEEAATAILGPGDAPGYLKFCTHADLIALEEVLADPEGFPIPKRLDSQYVLVELLSLVTGPDTVRAAKALTRIGLTSGRDITIPAFSRILRAPGTPEEVLVAADQLFGGDEWWKALSA